MAERVGWHCTACNRYFQSPVGGSPSGCRFCGADGDLVRIDHGRRMPAVAVGDRVVCRVLGETEVVVVGEVVAVAGDRVHVEADDGTGRYVVTADQVVTTRRSG